MANCLEVKDLVRKYKSSAFAPTRTVLDSMSFKVEAGKTTGFVGSNGAGKTTTLKCILGFIRPDSGQIKFFENFNLDLNVKARIGFLPERPYYYEFLTAHEFLSFHWQLSGGGAGFDKAGKDILERVNLPGVWNRRLRSFSKGMLQRIGLAQALLRGPEFLILDEPMSGLDPDGRILVKDILRAEKKRGTSIFFSSHLLNDMDELCDNLVIIDGGKTVFQGPISDFTHQGNVEESFRQLKKNISVKDEGGLK